MKINVGPKRGRMVIEFADLADLERIYRQIAEGRATPTPAAHRARRRLTQSRRLVHRRESPGQRV